LDILLLNQCFYPDVGATGQYLTEVAIELQSRGHTVRVITGRRGYDDADHLFPKRETYRGVDIRRISTISLGKSSRWRRALNFAGFLVNCALCLLVTPRQDAVIALTSPPLISLLGALFVKLKGGRFYFWVMDLNPDEAIAAGWLRENSLMARVLKALLNYSMRQAERIFVLDRFAQHRISAKGISVEKLLVVPPWSFDDAVRFDPKGREAFRQAHGLSEKFVVMYSGNHSPCHPLDSLLSAAEQLKSEDAITFCFVGGGSEKKKVERFAAERGLNNIVSLPYQPLSQVSASLSAADIHVVVMGDPFVGIVHPCKLYNILRVGAQVLYIGPGESHVTDILSKGTTEHYGARHGEVESLVAYIRLAANRRYQPRTTEFTEQFSAARLMPRIISALELRNEPAVAPQIESSVRVA
jgi:putative colanic acid biosynthesis glycosyltransferase WcaI